MNFRVCSLLLVLSLVTSLHAEDGDPRPQILVLGDFHSEPFRGSPSWAAILEAKYPNWNWIIDTKTNRVMGESVSIPKIKKGKVKGQIQYPGLREEIDDILSEVGHVDTAIIFLGTNSAQKLVYEKADASQRGRDLDAVLQKIKSHGASKEAKVAVVTALPVVDARLDQWSKDKFEGGEANAKSIAEEYRRVAANNGVELIDAYEFAWNKEDDAGKPGTLLGSSGWIMRDWAHREFARWIDDKIVDLDPQPADQAAYSQWQKEQQAMATLEGILSATSEGIVRSGNAFSGPSSLEEAKAKSPKAPRAEYQLSPEQLSGNSLSLVVKPNEMTYTVLAAGNAGSKNDIPTLHVETDEGEVKIQLPPAQMRLIDEATPRGFSDPNRYGMNIGKWRPYVVLSNKPAERRWLLLRFDLDDLKGREVKGGTLQLVHPATTNHLTEMKNGAPGPNVKSRFPDVGSAAVLPILGGDQNWNIQKANWETRDGEVGWTGGKVDQAARKKQVEEFLDGEVPATVRKTAEASISQ